MSRDPRRGITLVLTVGEHGSTDARTRVSRTTTRTQTILTVPPRQRGCADILRAIAITERTHRIQRCIVRIGRDASFSAARGTAVLANALAFARGIPMTSEGRTVRIVRPHYAAPPKITMPKNFPPPSKKGGAGGGP